MATIDPDLGKSAREQAARSVAHYLEAEEHLDAREARDDAEEVLRDAARLAGAAKELFFRPWWALAVRGMLAIVAGLLFIARPIEAVATLTLVFGAWCLVDGFAALVLAVASRRNWHLVLAGILGVVIGALVLWRPDEGLLAFYALSATWLIARGITEIAWGTKLGVHVGGGVARVWLVLIGLLSFGAGLLLLLAPQVGLPDLGLWIGAYALTFGLAFVGLSLSLRHTQRKFHVTT